MSTQEQVITTSPFDKVKWFLAIALLAAAVYANHYFVDSGMLVRVGSILGLIATGLAVGLSTFKGKAAMAFAKEARIEARKVVWPTRTETIQTTLIIVLAVTVVALLLYGLDWILVKLISLVTVRG
ncbi:MAG: preprotein translocase subunit SecE [Gammaproteobacteria bacterium]|nr:preprotein translocase subunit SecE [Gammaproteobacteria bacterium]MDH5629675.1 preprotein translocase subunit SecE [Gammaproteobacteria bacterium]